MALSCIALRACWSGDKSEGVVLTEDAEDGRDEEGGKVKSGKRICQVAENFGPGDHAGRSRRDETEQDGEGMRRTMDDEIKGCLCVVGLRKSQGSERSGK